MKPEDIARRYAHREGYRLIAFQGVALPVWLVAVRVQVEDRTELPIISEYVMRAIDAGFHEPERVASFLGIDKKTTERVLLDLLDTDDVVVTADNVGGQHRLRLTAKGGIVLRDAVSVAPRIAVLEFSVDALTGEVGVWRGGALSPHEVTESDLVEVPHPRKRPEIDVFTLSTLDDLIGASGGARRTVLEVIDVERRRRFFRDNGVAMVFRPQRGGEPEIEIAVDGVLSEEHSQGYRRLQSTKKRPILSVDVSEDPLDILRAIAPEGASRIQTSEAEVRPIVEERDRVLDRRRRVSATADQIAGGSDTARLRGEKEALEARIEELESELRQVPFRMLEVHEHRPLLLAALAESQERLLIISPWVTTPAVDEELIQGLRSALERGVVVYLGYGLDDWSGSSRDSPHVIRTFEKLATTHANFRLERFGDTHAKVLIADRRFAAITSFNWLSFRGDPRRTFRDERGALIASPQEVDGIFHRMRARFAGEEPLDSMPEPRTLEEILDSQRDAPSSADHVRLIAEGESHQLEFKETARWNVRADKETPEIRDAVVKTVAAFLNTDGGTLFIGVDDAGTPVGLDRDLKIFKKKGVDGFQTWLMGDLLKTRLTDLAVSRVSCHLVPVDGVEVCRLDVSPSLSPVYATVDKADGAFFIRVANSTHLLGTSEAVAYIREHFEDSG